MSEQPTEPSRKPRRKRLSISLSDDQIAWIQSQSDSLGFDDDGALFVAMLVRYAQRNGINLAVTAIGQARAAAPSAYVPERVHTGTYVPPLAGVTSLNEPAPDFEFTDGMLPDAAADSGSDDIASTLDEGLSAIDAMLANTLAEGPASTPSAPASPSFRQAASRLRSSTSMTPRYSGRAAVMDGPGSRTAPVGAGFIAQADVRELTPQQRIVRANNPQFFGR